MRVPAGHVWFLGGRGRWPMLVIWWLRSSAIVEIRHLAMKTEIKIEWRRDAI